MPLEEEEGGQIEELLQVEAISIVWVHFYLTQVLNVIIVIRPVLSIFYRSKHHYLILL